MGGGILKPFLFLLDVCEGDKVPLIYKDRLDTLEQF